MTVSSSTQSHISSWQKSQTLSTPTRLFINIITLSLLLSLSIISTITPLTSASISSHGQSYSTTYVEILEPTALMGTRIPLTMAQFSLLPPTSIGLTAQLVLMSPITGCTDETGTLVSNPTSLAKSPTISTTVTKYYDKIVLVERGNCQFIDKAHIIEQLGGIGFLISNVVDSMLPVPVASPDGSPPSRFLPLVGGSILGRDGNFLKGLLQSGIYVRVKIGSDSNDSVKPL